MKSKSQTHSIKDLKRLPLLFSIDTSKLIFDENSAPKEIQVLMCGKWNHPMYGPIIIEAKDITEFKKNFDAGPRRDIPVTEGHESFDEKPAVGWFKELTDKGTGGLWATMEWTPKGMTLLAEKSYKYFSPEFYTEYEDPETREIYKNVLVGGALTNKPYFKKMSAVVLSEKSINNNYIFSDMTIKEITAKKVNELNADEIAYLKEHKGELSAEELATFGSVLEEGKTETDEEKKAREEKEAGDANEAKGLNRDGSAKVDTSKKELTQAEKEANVAAGKNEDGTEKVEASEKNKVSISASEYKALQDMANKGAKAFSELREAGIKAETAKLICSEQNSKGKILPQNEAKAFSFMLGLTEPQRKVFAEIIDAIPSSKLFKELGNDGGTGGSAKVELDKKITKLMSEDKTLKYTDALKKVIASDKDLAKRYDEETARK